MPPLKFPIKLSDTPYRLAAAFPFTRNMYLFLQTLDRFFETCEDGASLMSGCLGEQMIEKAIGSVQQQ